MKIRKSIYSLLVITVVYVAILLYMDSQNSILSGLAILSEVYPVLVLFILISFLIRFIRWHWLLIRVDFHVPFRRGLLAYFSGFAFTATPGKVGELVRIRYFLPLGVPHSLVISAFLFERIFDLITVLTIASLAAAQFGMFLYVTFFVVLLILLVILFSVKPLWVSSLMLFLRKYRFRRLSRFVRVLRDGIVGIKVWNNPLDIVISFVLGILSWGLTSVAFVILLEYLSIVIPFVTAIAIYPLSILAGAASMMPGGVGATEVSIVALLMFLDVPAENALIAAIGIRISSLWFAIVCGIITIFILECRKKYL